jgi:hypothetical protein
MEEVKLLLVCHAKDGVQADALVGERAATHLTSG